MRYKLGIFEIFKLNRILCIAFFLAAANLYAQTADTTPTAPAETAAVRETEQTAVVQPVLTAYKGVRIGMAADEVRETLDKKPEVAYKDGFYYVFSDDESAQIMLDAERKVTAIVAIYRNGKAPKYTDVFGAEASLAETPDGRIYNLIRYPEAGFWVAYNRTAGDEPVITVTIQKF